MEGLCNEEFNLRKSELMCEIKSELDFFVGIIIYKLQAVCMNEKL